MLLLLLPGSLGALAEAPPQPPVRFYVIGDMPYRDQDFAPIESRLRAASEQRPAFIAHIGDIKTGSTLCSDAYFGRVASLFKVIDDPLVYTPGDNEWTDCHRAMAGSFDPLERLDALRNRFFLDDSVLRLSRLGVHRPTPEYPENVWFRLGATLVGALHVVGSGNNHRLDDPAALAELATRSQANQALFDALLAAARSEVTTSIVLLFHGDPLFYKKTAPPGLAPLRARLVQLLDAFPGDVLAIHGDSHRFSVDHPLDDALGEEARRFTRVIVPGSPRIAGVWITVDPDVPCGFSVAQEPLHSEDNFGGSAAP